MPTDFSTCADNALSFAVESAKIFPLQITLLHSLEQPDNLYTDYVGLNKEFIDPGCMYVKEEACKAEGNPPRIKRDCCGHLRNTWRSKGGCSQVVNEKNIDLVIMGTSGASGLKEKLWGSKTADIIAKSYVQC